MLKFRGGGVGTRRGSKRRRRRKEGEEEEDLEEKGRGGKNDKRRGVRGMRKCCHFGSQGVLGSSDVV